jgi:hypothetical protein
MILDSVQREQRLRFYIAWLIVGLSSFAAPVRAWAHDIPSDVMVQAFIKPSGRQLQLLVRAPLESIRDIDFPQNQSGYLDVEKLAPLLPDAASLWISDFIDVYEQDAILPKPQIVATHVSLASDRSFQSLEDAVRHVTGPRLLNGANIFWNQALLDVLFEYPIHSDRSRFSIRPNLERLGARVVTVVRFVPPNGTPRSYEFVGRAGLVRLDPSWYQAAATFVRLGFFHILDGTDHLLFLLCLVIPFRRWRGLLAVVTAFTVAHSITLIASAWNLAPDALWFPPLIETLIAASIVWMAFENIIGASTIQRRWIVAFCFGLVHGFGFSFALREKVQLAGTHLLASLLAFNVGVEFGQILVLSLLAPALYLLFRFVVAERMGTILLSALVAHTGWHWMIDRGEQLRRYSFEWPNFNAGALALVLRSLLFIAILLGLFMLVLQILRHRFGRVPKSADSVN